MEIQTRHVRLRAAGVSLVELMISIAIGMMLLAALTTVFVNVSSARSELERTSRQIENGRYAVEILSDDLRVAGFYGELNVGSLPVPAALPDPCSTDPAVWTAAIPFHLQGYDDGSGAVPCLPLNVKPNTDIVVVRRVKTCVAGLSGCETATDGKAYLQASLCNTETTPYVLGFKGAAAFPLTRKDCTTGSALREYLVNLYFISDDNRAGQNVPTLSRLELAGPNLVQVPLVEGIEALNIEYGIDHDNDGQPDAYTADPTTYTYPGCATCTAGNNWANVVTVHLSVLARGIDPAPGYLDTKTYNLGRDAAGNAVTVGPKNDRYRRNVYTALVRIANPAGRRDKP